ncbi:unnamed protein product, partial [marine sediment metagenome]
MSDTETTEEVQPDPDEPKGLRKQLNVANEKLRVANAREMERAFIEIGLRADEGLGKAILKEYEGEITAEAIAEYAKTEYKWEGTTVSEHPEAQTIAQGQAALDQVGESAGSVPLAPTEGQTLAEAEAKGDYAKTMAMKGDQVA